VTHDTKIRSSSQTSALLAVYAESRKPTDEWHARLSVEVLPGSPARGKVITHARGKPPKVAGSEVSCALSLLEAALRTRER